MEFFTQFKSGPDWGYELESARLALRMWRESARYDYANYTSRLRAYNQKVAAHERKIADIPKIRKITAFFGCVIFYFCFDT